MAKKALYYPQAEQLYVVEQCTVAEISSRLKLGERTVRNWKDEGKWDEKRQAAIAARRGFHEELYDFGQHMLRKIREDEDAGIPVAPHRYHALMSICPNLLRVKEYEEIVRQKAGKDAAAAPDDKRMAQAVRKELGLEEEEPPAKPE